MQRLSPPLRQQRLGRILRELRACNGMTLAGAATQLAWSTAKLSRIETGQTRPSTADVTAALDLYSVSDQTRHECMTLARQAAARPWWWPYRNVLGDWVALETEAHLMRYWQPQLVPGLLQTEAYAHAVIAAHAPWEDPAVISLKVRARMARQHALTCPDPIFVKAVIGEEALRRPIGGRQVMLDQIDQLTKIASWDNVEVRVLPQSVGAHAGLAAGFLVLSLPGMPAVLFREGGVDELTHEERLVREHEMRFEHIVAAALSPQSSLDLIALIKKEI